MTAEPVPAETTIDQARAIANTGMRVLPIKPGRKNPPMASWQNAASIEEKAISAWWNGLYRDHGIGIAMGMQPDGRNLFALDIDTHHEHANGFDTLHDLQEQHAPLPATVNSITGGNGQHLIFTAPAGTVIRNQQSAGQRIGPGIDVRGEGGQIVVAPTIHPDTGHPYRWKTGRAPWEIDIAPAPDWLLELVTEPPPAAPSTPTPTPATRIDAGDETPADTLRRRWNWTAELDRAGWQQNRTDANGDTYWARPGKNPRDGHSAVLHGTNGPLVIFTTEIPQTLRQLGHATRDGSGFAYSPFDWYAAHHHGGNTSDAARAIRAEMMGGATTAPTAAPDTTDADADTTEPTYDDTLANMLVDWSTFWDADHNDAEWLAEPILAAKRSTAIYAPGGTGKSLLALYIAASIATGRPLFGRPPQPPRHVLYLDYEMTADDLAERLTSMEFDGDDLSHLHYALLPSLPGLDEPEGGKAVVRMAELVDAELVVIDTFGRAVHGDENDADTVRNWYRWTGLHLKAAGRAFARVDHAGKDIAKGQRGTSAKNDDVDVVWQMTAKDGGAFALAAKKRRMGWVPMTVELLMDETAALRFDLAKGHTWPAGTAEMAAVLDNIGVPVEASKRAARAALKDSGKGGREAVVSAAIKYRRERTNTFHFSGDDPVDNSTETAGTTSGTTPDEDGGYHLGYHPTPKTVKPQVDGHGYHSGYHRVPPADADGYHSASLKDAVVPSVTDDDAATAPIDPELF